MHRDGQMYLRTETDVSTHRDRCIYAQRQMYLCTEGRTDTCISTCIRLAARPVCSAPPPPPCVENIYPVKDVIDR